MTKDVLKLKEKIQNHREIFDGVKTGYPKSHRAVGKVEVLKTFQSHQLEVNQQRHIASCHLKSGKDNLVEVDGWGWKWWSLLLKKYFFSKDLV